MSEAEEHVALVNRELQYFRHIRVALRYVANGTRLFRCSRSLSLIRVSVRFLSIIF